VRGERVTIPWMDDKIGRLWVMFTMEIIQVASIIYVTYRRDQVGELAVILLILSIDVHNKRLIVG
jgi:hypothetical protein